MAVNLGWVPRAISPMRAAAPTVDPSPTVDAGVDDRGQVDHRAAQVEHPGPRTSPRGKLRAGTEHERHGAPRPSPAPVSTTIDHVLDHRAVARPVDREGGSICSRSAALLVLQLVSRLQNTLQFNGAPP